MKDVPVAQSLAVKFADKTKGAISTDYALDRSILSPDTTYRKDYPDSEAKLHLSRIGRKAKPSIKDYHSPDILQSIQDIKSAKEGFNHA